MCGRTCLTLEPSAIICACKYKASGSYDRSGKNQTNNEEAENKSAESLQAAKREENAYFECVMPEWRDVENCGRRYIPSYNIAPTDVTPVLVSADHFRNSAKNSQENGKSSRLLIPMMWGMIPFWHKGDYRKHGLTTNNCRLEHMVESKLYRGPFRRGQRCVVLCENMYEWQTTKSAKPSERAAYVLHMPQTDSAKIYDKSTWKPENVNLFKMAGLFDVWQDEHGEKMYSYTIITFESSQLFSWLHHRMPAILETEEQVNNWLDFKRVSDEEALATIRPATNLKWYRVANIVNNSRNKSDQCNKPIELVQQPTKKLPINKTMLAWLNVRKRREESIKSQDASDDESSNQVILQGVGSRTPVTTTTSESEAENPPKRPHFRDFKNVAKSQVVTANTSIDSASTSENVQAKSDNNSCKPNGSDEL